MKPFFPFIVTLAFIPLAFSAIAQPSTAGDRSHESATDLVTNLTRKYCVVDTDDPKKSDALSSLKISRADLCECVTREVSYSMTDETFNQRVVGYLAVTEFMSKPERASEEQIISWDTYLYKYSSSLKNCAERMAN